MLYQKSINFESIINEAKGCQFCRLMNDKEPVIGYQNGNIHADLLFIAEAPGPRGANITGIPLSGDKTGENFQRLIDYVELERKDIFITNAVLCCPTDKQGFVRSPNGGEMRNCSNYLARIIDLIGPKVIVTLGVKALKSLDLINRHDFKLSKDAGIFKLWAGRYLLPLYHPSPLVIKTGKRSFEQQQHDYKKLVHNYKNRILKGLEPIN